MMFSTICAQKLNILSKSIKKAPSSVILMVSTISLPGMENVRGTPVTTLIIVPDLKAVEKDLRGLNLKNRGARDVIVRWLGLNLASTSFLLALMKS